MTLEPNPDLRRRRAFTLVETLITMGIVSMSGVLILAMVVYGIEIRELTRERNAAMRVANDYVEGLKREWFAALKPIADEDVLIDDRGTPDNPKDDIFGVVSVKFYDSKENELMSLPATQQLVTVRTTVTWNPAGRRHKSQQTLTLTTLLAP